MRKLVEFYEAQIGKKDAEIAKLRAEVNRKDIDISDLRTHMSSLTTSFQELEQQNVELGEVVNVQDEMLNKGFIKIGTKAELAKIGLLSKGSLFKKSKVNYSNLDQNLFQEVDIREAVEIPIPSKNVKILTPVRQNSYSLESTGNSVVLHIKEPSQFWSTSNYLIIQIN